MTVRPDKSYFIDYTPRSGEIDLIPRIMEGISQAKADGFDEVFIIEDDDYYPNDYFERMQLGKYGIVGIPYSHYYNLKDRRHQLMNHPIRSSLFCTGLKIKSLDYFSFDCKHLDIAIWNHVKENKISRKFVYDITPIGIKHGFGKCIGSGHHRQLKMTDNEMTWLKRHVDSEAFIFYKSFQYLI